MSVSILVVDDESPKYFASVFAPRCGGALMSCIFLFRRGGARQARRGHLAVADLSSSPTQYAVVDGPTLLRRIKERWPAYPAMMVTAYRDDERRRLAGEYGAIEFIAKPVDFGHLKVQLRQLARAAD